MSNSSLVDYKKLSPNNSGPRTHAIDRITPHCYVGQASVEDMAAWLCNPSAQASCNYGIGSDGRVALIVDEGSRSWCSSSSANDQRAITIECASDKTDPYRINDTVYAKLLDLMEDICRRYGKKKLLWLGDKAKTLAYTPAADEIVMTVHRWFAAKACPGDFIYSRMGKIAEEITRRLSGGAPVEKHWYRVRAAWERPETQTGAYEILENAKAEADKHPGYSVYDESGKAVYTSKGPEPGKYPSGIPVSKEQYIAACGSIAHEMMKETGILASVITAQCCLETGFGLGADAHVLTEVNNLLGMKVDLINGSWKDYTVWKGGYIVKPTKEWVKGRKIIIDCPFRKYTDYYECIRDYEMFLLNVRNNKGYKYRRIQGWTDPRQVIEAIRIGSGTAEHPEGYFTDPDYVEKTMNMISQYNLRRFDDGVTPEPVAKDIYAVQRTLKETEFRRGLFHDLDNAKKQADIHWGFRVFNIETGELVYQPKLTKRQKFVAEMLHEDEIVRADIAAGHEWSYTNKDKKGKTFEETRKKGYYRANCVDGVQWALLSSGVVGTGREAIQWYGAAGFIRWLSDHAEADARKYFEIIEIKGRTVKTLMDDGTLLPGDILIYQTLSHTNAYLGNRTSFDSGHANCTGSGEGAKYTKWVSETPYTGYKVQYIMRLKEEGQPTGKTMRVHINAFKVKANATRCQADCKEKTGFDAFKELGSDGQWHVYCGSFSDPDFAAERLAYVQTHGYPKAFPVEAG